jgi:hypothetical protein
MPYIRKSHLTPTVERVRLEELLSKARSGSRDARRELLEVHKIRVYVQGDTLVDSMNRGPQPRKAEGDRGRPARKTA